MISVVWKGEEGGGGGRRVLRKLEAAVIYWPKATLWAKWTKTSRRRDKKEKNNKTENKTMSSEEELG